MKVEKNSNISRSALSRNERILENKTVKQYKQIDDKMLRAASLAVYSEGLAQLLRQGCPKFIAREIEQDFYSDRSDINSENSIYQDIQKRYSGEEFYEVCRMKEKVEKYPKILKEIMSSRNQKEKQYRFNGYECAELMEIADKIEPKQFLFFTILESKNDDKSPKFSIGQIYKLMDNSDKIYLNGDDVKFMSSIRDMNGNQLLSDKDCMTLLFDADVNTYTLQCLDELAKTVDVTQQNVSFKTLLNSAKEQASEQTLLNSAKEQASEQSLEEVLSKSKRIKLNPELTKYGTYNKLMNAIAFENNYIEDSDGNVYNANTLRKYIDSDTETFEAIMNLKNSDGTPRFSDDEYLYLVSVLGAVTNDFLKYTEIKNADGTPALDANMCVKLVHPTYNGTTAQNIEKLFGVVDPQTGEQRINLNNFNHEFCKEIKDDELFKKNLFLRNEATNEYRFSVLDCFSLDTVAKEINEHPEFYEKMLEIKDDNNKPRFDEHSLRLLVKRAGNFESNSELAEKLLNMRHENKFRFSPLQVLSLLSNKKTIASNSGFFEKILTDTNTKGSPRFDGNECIDLISAHENGLINKDNQEMFEKLYNAKDQNGYKFDADACLRLLKYASSAITEHEETFDRLVTNPNIPKSQIVNFMHLKDLENIEKHFPLFEEIFGGSKPLYKNTSFIEKVRMFRLAEKIEKAPELWERSMDKEFERDTINVDRLIRCFVRDYYVNNPSECSK